MDIIKRAEELLRAKLGRVRVIRDTTNFMAIDRGDVLELGGRLFVVQGVTYEGRFGLDDQPKYWVKTARDMQDGSAKIIKLAFYEEFTLRLGRVSIYRFRSPGKESRILEKVRGNDFFMQGVTVKDTAGNPVRILERISGRALDLEPEAGAPGHHDYYLNGLRPVLESLVPMISAIGELHQAGERHGDIRRDHIFVEHRGGGMRWIDFDYNYELVENPFGLDLFGLGNVLCFAVGRGIPITHNLKREGNPRLDIIDPGDLSPVLPNRVFNLRKLYPYLPESLNRVLMHFSASSGVYYEQVDELLADLQPAINELPLMGEE